MSTQEQKFLNIVRSMNQLLVLRYLNIYDHNINVNKLEIKKISEKSTIPPITMKLKRNYLLMVDAIQF